MFLLKLLFISINLPTALYGILLSCLGGCSLLMLDKNRSVGLSIRNLLPVLNLSSSSKCSQLKSFLLTYYFGRCTSELDEQFLLSPSHNRSTPHSNRLHDFSVTILRCYKNDFDNNFSTRKARFWNFLFAESFSLYYDLKARVTRHL